MSELDLDIKVRPGLDPLDLPQGVMVVRTDLEGRFVYANRAYLQYMGLQILPIGASALEHTDPRDVPAVMEVVHRALENPHQTFWVEFSKPTRKPWNRSRWEFMALLDAARKAGGRAVHRF
ncbi:MAG: hypothetical protein KatS3mg071_2257 [Meiothermus sp.]|nr:MAG: hypothetical protein KatS3mg071_2257 [Meiothermus sp.]